MRVSTHTAVAGAAIALVVGMSTAASATSSGIVTVTHNDGGTQVGTTLPGQPLVSVSVDNNGVCVGFSYEEGSCVPVTTS